MYEIYTTGGGLQLERTLNAVAAFTNSPNAQAMVAIALLVGLMILVFQIIFHQSWQKALMSYIVIAFISALSLGHRSTVVVFDKTQGPLWFRTVANVPTSVAYVGSFTSRVSNVLTTQMEALFSPPTNLAYQRHGMLFGATLMTKTARWRAVTATVHENLTEFMDQCVIDAVDLRYMTPDVVTRTGNLETTITANMPASLSYYDHTTRTTQACSVGWPNIQASLNTEVQNVIAAQAASTFQGPNAAPAIQSIKDTITDFSTFAGFAATSAENHIKQSMLIAAFDDAANRGISATGNAAALQHLQSARAELQTRSSYQAIGANALNWVPYMKIVFENLYYGAFPIALALMMTPLALSVIRGYFGGFVWLASWEPLSAILHGIMLDATVERFQTVTSSSITGAYTQSVMSWANHFGVYSIGEDVAVMAGYLMMSVPFVAAALFFGAQRMVGLATSVLAVSQSAASQTGQEIASGNLSYANATVGNRSFGNVSMDNYARNNASYDNISANRSVTSPFTDVGRSSSYASDGSLITTNRNGSVGIEGGSSRVNTATNLALGNSVVSTLRTQAGEMMERGTSARNTFENSLSQLESNMSSYMQSVRTGEAFSSGSGVQASAEHRASISEAVSTLEQFAKTHNISNNTALSLGIHAGLNVNGKEGTPWSLLSAGTRANLEKQGITSDSYNELLQATKIAGVDQAVSNLDRSYRDYSSIDNGSLDETADNGTRASFDSVQRQGRTAEVYRRGSSSFNEAADRAESQLVDNRVDLSAPFADWMMDNKRMSATQVAEVLSARGDNATGRIASLRQEFAQQFVDDLVKPEMDQVFGKDIPDAQNPGAIGPNQQPYNKMSGRPLQNYSDGWLDSEVQILDQSGAQPSMNETATAVRSQSEGLSERPTTGSSVLHNTLPGGLNRDGNRIEWQSSSNGERDYMPLNEYDRDAVIRTVAAEAGNESRRGQVAVASVIRNRIEDSRFGNDVSSVVFAPGQFSAWNNDGTGNSIGRNIDPNSEAYKEIGNAVDDVFLGFAVDPTQGATHYYSPRGMQEYVTNGHQTNTRPTWLAEQAAESGGTVTIGNHVFAGKAENRLSTE